VEGEDAFNDDDRVGCDGVEVAEYAGMGFEVVDGTLNGLAVGEAADVLYDEFGFE
jgi:hypothetical protein